MYIKLAWRNIWRNKLRTLLTTGAVIMAYFLCSLLASLQLGSHNHMIESMLKSSIGYIQINQEDYFQTKDLNLAFELKDVEVLEKSHSDIETITPRIEGFALASIDSTSKPVITLGIDFQKEKSLGKFDQKLIEGSYTEPNSVIINHYLAKKMNLKVGDSLALIGSGYHGASAVGLYNIGGIAKIVMLGRGVVLMPFPMASEFFGTYGKASSYFVGLPSPEKNLEEVQEILQAKNSDLTVSNWKEMIPELKAQIDFENSSNVIMGGILYFIVSFGLFGTILMMTEERKREFGILMAIGMQKKKLMLVLLLEGFFISFIGIIVALLPTYIILTYLKDNPISIIGAQADMMERMGFEPVYKFSNEIEIFIAQMEAVAGIALLISIYPIVKIYSLHIIQSIRS